MAYQGRLTTYDMTPPVAAHRTDVTPLLARLTTWARSAGRDGPGVSEEERGVLRDQRAAGWRAAGVREADDGAPGRGVVTVAAASGATCCAERVTMRRRIDRRRGGVLAAELRARRGSNPGRCRPPAFSQQSIGIARAIAQALTMHGQLATPPPTMVRASRAGGEAAEHDVEPG